RIRCTNCSGPNTMKKNPGIMCTRVSERCRTKTSSSPWGGADPRETCTGCASTNPLRAVAVTPINASKITVIQIIRGVLSTFSITDLRSGAGCRDDGKIPSLEIRIRWTKDCSNSRVKFCVGSDATNRVPTEETLVSCSTWEIGFGPPFQKYI